MNGRLWMKVNPALGYLSGSTLLLCMWLLPVLRKAEFMAASCALLVFGSVSTIIVLRQRCAAVKTE